MKLKKAIALSALMVGMGFGAPQWAAASEGVALPEMEWGHKGAFGRFDVAQIKRGAQVATEVCLGCHSIKYIKFDHLRSVGLSEADVNALAETAGKNKKDFMITELAPEDAKESYGTVPPDLSLMTKARKGYENYVYGILTGYLNEEEAAKVEEANEDGEITDAEAEELAHVLHMSAHGAEGKEKIRQAVARIANGDNFSKYFPGNFFAMPQPLMADAVEYADGTEATLPQLSEDVTAFLAWASEPKQTERKEAGVKVVLYLVVLTAMLYAVKRRIWARIH
ncbi:cytochrome c1 [Magnetofaba australis]|uniref:Putative cytochrome C1 n=1 Tax=Magnetofaba australis IT-1 TaxID=1434232 RepID=A0A1Y2K879_9PROT|nr:cytochrome c1 [Magnetofaba australis]OSM06948.1 putative cytochrome C1 [Magnetofaba australis IT-1]